MRKLFPFDRDEVAHEAELARRDAARRAREAAEAEQRRLDGERRAADVREFNTWFQGALREEAAQRRQQRIIAASVRSPVERTAPPDHDRRLSFVLVHAGVEIFRAVVNPRRIEAMAARYLRLRRELTREGAITRCTESNPAANGVLHFLEERQVDMARCCAAWLLLETPRRRAWIYDSTITTVGLVVEMRDGVISTEFFTNDPDPPDPTPEEHPPALRAALGGISRPAAIQSAALLASTRIVLPERPTNQLEGEAS